MPLCNRDDEDVWEERGIDEPPHRPKLTAQRVECASAVLAMRSRPVLALEAWRRRHRSNLRAFAIGPDHLYDSRLFGGIRRPPKTRRWAFTGWQKARRRQSHVEAREAKPFQSLCRRSRSSFERPFVGTGLGRNEISASVSGLAERPRRPAVVSGSCRLKGSHPSVRARPSAASGDDHELRRYARRKRRLDGVRTERGTGAP